MQGSVERNVVQSVGARKWGEKDGCHDLGPQLP